jgi:uncharacterized protein YbjT (DUF2867 family)
MKIIVNAGNIGTPLALELAGMGVTVTLAVRTPKPNPEWDRLGIRQVPFDINRLESMTSALSGADVFFSLTPLVENFVEAGTKTMLAAKDVGVRRIVRSSAQGAGPAAGIALGRWHYAVEEVLAASGIPFTVLRPANFMQNFLGFGIPQTIKAQGAFYSAQGEGRVSAIDTRDISAVAVKVLTQPGHEGQRYELTGGEALSNGEIAARFSAALGREIRHVSLSEAAANEGMAKAGVPPWLANLLTELTAIGRAGHLATVEPDTQRLLGRKPISFAQFIQDHLAAFRN